MKALFRLKRTWLMIGMLMLLALGATIAVFAMTSHESEPVATGKDDTQENITVEEYYEEELELDKSEENILYEEEVVTQEQSPSNNSQTVAIQEPSPYYIKVNRQSNCVTVYGMDANGNYTVPIKAMVCSVGLNNNTPTGVFKTSTKYYWRALYGNVYGQYAYRINGPILFHSVPYYTQNKWDLESEEYNKLGQAASMGCVRLAVKDAKWLMDNCPQGTTVEIYDSPDPGPLGKPSALKIDLSSPNKGWDPTDPDESNPWRYTKPSILGATDKTLEKGENIDILADVSATDYLGNVLTVVTSGSIQTGICGTYSITYTTTDANGNSTSTTVNFYVQDTIKPTLSVSGEVTITDADATSFREKIMSMLSAKDGNEVLTSSGITLDVTALANAISSKSYGTYTCYATVKDAAGNTSERVIIQVNYKDGPPVITVTGEILPITINCDDTESAENIANRAKEEACNLISGMVSVTDDKDGAITPKCEATSVMLNDEGMPVAVIVTVSASDTSGHLVTEEISVDISVA